MPPKKPGGKRGKTPPQPVPDLEWEDIPYICPSYNQLFNQKIRIRIRSLFAILDTDKKKKLDNDRAAIMVRATGLFPPDLEMDEWFKVIGKKGDDDLLYMERNALCDGIYEILREGRWRPPTPKQAVKAWRRLDMQQRGTLDAENLNDIFAQEEKENGMTPTELKKLIKFTAEMPGGVFDYVSYVDGWYKTWLANRIPRPRDRIPRRQFDDTI
ncbi:hypothetical protein BV898_09861 [Hypsibius exemplaris]|uniref:Uncharacterized protein n=1 Tax=Hypsibius exemplaris TaxID=2072580 RepID=A0A1W0WL54_HYPEX|nr:hypothetical protein BV898_09861 [Hypsibius exemplaris]